MTDTLTHECKDCMGTRECHECFGDGLIPITHDSAVECEHCHGTGKCPWCDEGDE